MSAPKRSDAGAAVAGLFNRTSATGGLAQRDPALEPPAPRTETPARLRLGVELTEEEIGFLRGLSRPARTGQPRTLGSKFVATGVLAAAIELLHDVPVEMFGVQAND